MTESEAFWRYKFMIFMKRNKRLTEWGWLYTKWCSAFCRSDFFKEVSPQDFITEVGYDSEDMRKLDSKWMQYICVLENKIKNRKIELAFNEK
jgi:hypothetical protein